MRGGGGGTGFSRAGLEPDSFWIDDIVGGELDRAGVQGRDE